MEKSIFKIIKSVDRLKKLWTKNNFLKKVYELKNNINSFL